MLEDSAPAKDDGASPLHPALQPMRLEWADELQTLVDSGDNSFADIKLQVKNKIVPVCFLIAIASRHNFYIQVYRRSN